MISYLLPVTQWGLSEYKSLYYLTLSDIELAEQQNATEDVSCLPKMVMSGEL